MSQDADIQRHGKAHARVAADSNPPMLLNPSIWKSTLRDTLNDGRFGNRPYAISPGLEFTALAWVENLLNPFNLLFNFNPR